MLDAALTALNIALPFGYAATWGLYIRHFFQPDDQSQFLGTRSLYGVVVLHTLFLVLRGVQQSAFPLASKAEFLSLLALSIAAIYALAETKEQESHTGMFFLSIGFLFQLSGSLLLEPPGSHALLLEHPIYGIHAVLMVFGFAALAVGALYAVMYILLARQLKSRSLGVFFKRLPPLSKLEGMSKLATLSGIALLGMGLLAGHFVAIVVLPTFNMWDPKIVLTNIIWLAYLIGFIIIRVRGLSGLRIGYLSVFAYLTLMIGMIASSVLTTTFHSFQ